MCGGDAAFLSNYYDHLFIFVTLFTLQLFLFYISVPTSARLN